MFTSDYLLTDAAQKTLRLSENLANEYAHGSYGPAHLLWAVMDEDVGLHGILQQLETEPSAIRQWALNQVTQIPKDIKYVAIPRANEQGANVLKETQKLCLRYSESEISPLSILEALITPDVGFDKTLLRRLPLALYEIIEWRGNNANHQLPSANGKGGNGSSGSTATSNTPGYLILDKYCDNVNQMGTDGRIDPVLGRDKELKQLVEILGKRLSPNVLIVGEPGVGKTSIVGGLALKIVEGKVPEKLKTATIFSLDVSGRLVAGAFKGEVEERLKSILKAVKEYGTKAILFIDEIHILLDEKGPVGSGVVNLLKPELARGEITLIGATTQSEYQKYIEKDSAFNRRFSRLVIQEPDELVAIEMLKGLVGKYEEFHGLKIENEALTTSVQLAKKYIRDKHLPASAIELMDFTLACAVQMNATSKTVLEDLEKEWTEATDPNPAEYRTKMKQQLSELIVGRLLEDDEEEVEEIATTFAKLKEWTSAAKEEINAEDIEAIAAYKSGIPIGRMRSNEQEKLKNIHEILRKRVVGQDHVVDAVARGLKAFRTNLNDPREPGAIFFFTGPTGTGKTELAKAIAELLFDDEDAMLRFDMSEFQESHSVATLLGAPPGYAGYDEGGILVNNVRKKPYSVVLFDEIEKAHQDIYGIFLQMLTDSRLTDKQGKIADFSNSIIIFTSNAGAHEIVDIFNSGGFPKPDELKTILRATKHFKDEFLGRVDTQILPFAPLTSEVAQKILHIHFGKFTRLIKKQHNITVHATNKVMEHILEIGFDPLFGARPLKNAIKTFLIPPLADEIIMGNLEKGNKIILDLDKEGNLVITKK